MLHVNFTVRNQWTAKHSWIGWQHLCLHINFFLSSNRFNNRDKIKIGHAARSNVLGEKFTWFLEQIGDRKLPPTPEEFDEMISL